MIRQLEPVLFIDLQALPPLCRCDRCGWELYAPDAVCPRCGRDAS